MLRNIVIFAEIRIKEVFQNQYAILASKVIKALHLTVNEYHPFSGIDMDEKPHLSIDRSITEKLYLPSKSILYITKINEDLCCILNDIEYQINNEE